MMDYKQLETAMEKAVTSLKERLADIMEIAQIGGMLDEQNRIIKLLEDDYKGQDGIIWAEPHLQDLIALIKGEQK